jgi:hypothetical protein
MAALEQRMSKFDPRTTVLGDIFVKHAPYFKMYTQVSTTMIPSSALVSHHNP